MSGFGYAYSQVFLRGSSTAPPPVFPYTVATGGVVTRNGDYIVHTFNSAGIFEVIQLGSDNTFRDLGVAGGGGGGCFGGGGGAGGYQERSSFTLPVGLYSITIGLGGTGATNISASGNNGGNSTFDGITLLGGGVGANGAVGMGGNGGNGGGGISSNLKGSGTIGQGFDGANGASDWSGGGGGASETGHAGSSFVNGNGGNGIANNITGTSITRAGGGGGGGNGGTQGLGGAGGGGNGTTDVTTAQNGTPNTGGGGGGGGFGGGNGHGGNGGNGVWIISYESPLDPPSISTMTGEILDLSVPSLLDSSGNGYDSVLGASLPGGFTAPTLVGSNLVFSGNQTIKLNAALSIISNSINTHFISFYCDTPDVIENLFQLGLDDVCGTRIAVFDRNSNHWVNSGGVYKNEGAISEPAAGLSLPKIQKGYNVIGLSLSETYVTVYCNGINSTYETSPGVGSASLSGWIGGFPGTTNNVYTIASNIILLGGTKIKVFDKSGSISEMQAPGDKLMKDYLFSQIVFEGDSITQGFTIDTNAHNWPAIISAYLIDNTIYKFASVNIGVGSRFLNQMSAGCDFQNQLVPFDWTGQVYINPVKPSRYASAKNVYVLLAGINDLANGVSLTDMQSALTEIIAFRKSQGYACFVLSVTSDANLSAGAESQRLTYNTWLAAQASIQGFFFINTCSDPNLAGQPPEANAYFSDGVHYTTLTCSIVAPMVYNSIITNY